MSDSRIPIEGPPDRRWPFALLAAGQIFVHPAASVRNQARAGAVAWLIPVGLAAALVVTLARVNLPLTIEAMHAEMRQSMSDADLAAAIRASSLFAPVQVLLSLIVSSGLLFAASTIAAVRVEFRRVFTLVAYASLIPAMAQVAQSVVLHWRGHAASLGDFRPAFGLDLVMGGTGPLGAALNYFSIFTLWYMAALALSYAAMTGTGKAKALAVTAPVWLLGLVFAMAA